MLKKELLSCTKTEKAFDSFFLTAKRKLTKFQIFTSDGAHLNDLSKMIVKINGKKTAQSVTSVSCDRDASIEIMYPISAVVVIGRFSDYFVNLGGRIPNCENLSRAFEDQKWSSIPEDFFIHCANTTIADNLFLGSSFEQPLPDALLRPLVRVKTLAHAFEEVKLASPLSKKFFWGCDSLEDVSYCLGQYRTPNGVEFYFSAKNISKAVNFVETEDFECTVHVPKGSVTAQTFKALWGYIVIEE